MVQIAGSRELLEQVRNKGLCTLCGACAGLCPYHKPYNGKMAMVFDCDLAEGRCYAFCPFTEADVEALSQLQHGKPYEDSPLGEYRMIAASRAGEKAPAGEFQNGGTVSSLIAFALKEGTVDAAVMTGQKGLMPEPRIVTKPEEVLGCSKTKYAANPTVSGFNQAVRDGYRNMAVVGTGCQMTALAQIRTNPTDKPDFVDAAGLMIGLFCTWSLDTRQFLAFLKENHPDAEITGMDVPPPPAEIFVIKTTKGDIEVPLHTIREFTQKGCGHCGDMTAKWADISVGAFEGKSDWNTLIVRTERGEQLVNRAKAAGYLKLAELPEENLQHLTAGVEGKLKRARENAMKEAS